MTKQYDHIVIGGGVMGLATTWQLASRGESVLLLERFGAHHTNGASHGSTRNLNNAYSEDHYLDLFTEASALWRELESGSGTQLLGLHGLVTHGDPERITAAHDALQARGADISVMCADEAAAHWTGMKFEGNVLIGREAGIIFASRALDAFSAAAVAAGADIQRGVKVLEIDPLADGAYVTVQHPSGVEGVDGPVQDLFAAHVTVTAGAWSEPLLRGIIDLPTLTVTEEHPAHFAPRSNDLVWPSFNHLLGAELLDEFGADVYGMPSPGEGTKVGFHCVGDEVDPDARTFHSTERLRSQLRTYVSEWFPGLDPDTAAEISCTYTSTASGDFVLDTVGPITVGAGFSGHGFKFAPAIGRVLADAAMGRGQAPSPFLLETHRAW
ncbi:FAD-dependent oxidoreductase [Leucobacter viscericola]|uniref:FAD-dependent oxidoreductase n=1 Tax=Leucobacter viscericola TaxID=2714935 RepID=A0A6G7XH69_9MICO|nr:FAD-dependent oxidoreductase [Leucobacter viscericola]QIK63711.1 FAD-dependent oxidoreductase [Leucobacter viscericola]